MHMYIVGVCTHKKLHLGSTEQHLWPQHPGYRRISNKSEHYCLFPNNVALCSLFKSNVFASCSLIHECTVEVPGQGMQSQTAQDMGGTKAFFSDYLNVLQQHKKSLNDSLNRLKKTQTVCRVRIAKEYEGIVTEKPSTWILPLWYTQKI